MSTENSGNGRGKGGGKSNSRARDNHHGKASRQANNKSRNRSRGSAKSGTKSNAVRNLRGDVRAVAATTIGTVINGEAFNGTELPEALSQSNAKDQALYRELCFGTLRHFPMLDGIASLHLQKPFAAKDADVRALLAVGLYQLLFTRIPDHASVATTVEACQRMGKVWAKGILNAILRKILRQTEALAEPDYQQLSEHFAAEGLSAAACHSLPEWLYQRYRQDWPEHWQAIVEHGRHAPVLALRVAADSSADDEPAAASTERYRKELAEAGIEASASRLVDTGLLLERGVGVDALPGFSEGRVSVQDCGAQLCAELLSISSGQRLLDACAAPGGKTLALLQKAAQQQGTAKPDVELTAMDVSAQRLARVDENLQRGGMDAELVCADACAPANWWDGRPYDSILLDAPCTGSGVINRHPDIKLLRRAADAESFARQQRQLLDALWPLLAAGGTLLYITCSILAEENEQVIAAFLDATGDARAEAIVAEWGIGTANGRQLLPNKGQNDGFFFAKITKHKA